MQRHNLDLIHVIWDDDHGIVSLKNNTVVCYAYGDFDGSHSSVPTVEITDADFALIMEPDPADSTWFEVFWDDVPRLLNHPSFYLMKRAGLTRENETADSTGTTP